MTKIDRSISVVERAKLDSQQLRGTIAESLSGDAANFEANDAHLLKFHGIYQQDDRDVRATGRALGIGKEHSFMVRVKIPGGRLTASQFLALDELALRYASMPARLTTRQGMQFHGVVKGDLKATLADIDQQLLSTFAACGDVGRNVMTSPCPESDGSHNEIQALAERISFALRPQTGAYHEIWLDGEKQRSSGQLEEPLYGVGYLPRKLKLAVAHPSDNSVDVFAQDIGLLAVINDGHVSGLNVAVGGGLGMTHKKADTFARLGSPLGYVSVDLAIPVVRAIGELFRDHGNRKDRRHARLKYLIEDWGLARFRTELEQRLGFKLEAWRPTTVSHRDSLGFRTGVDADHGTYGIAIANGRLVDRGRTRTRSAVRRLVDRYGTDVILTPDQNLILTGITADSVDDIEIVLKAFGVPYGAGLSLLRRFAVACPALPMCGLALAEAERVLPDVLDLVEQSLEQLGIADRELCLRMTGCPNGCARPYTADLGLVGRGKNRYDIFIGGGRKGERLADLYATEVPLNELMPRLEPLLVRWRQNGRSEESLGDFYQRLRGNPPTRRLLTGSKQEPSEPEISALLTTRPLLQHSANTNGIQS